VPTIPLTYTTLYALSAAQADEKLETSLEKTSIVASNSINEEILISLKDQNHSIDAFGIGTNLASHTLL
jgi:nicotinic acid phosphoribosyltransferase